jgi:hypothetical protein
MKKLMMATLIALSGSVASATCNMQSTAGLFAKTNGKIERTSSQTTTNQGNREGVKRP